MLSAPNENAVRRRVVTSLTGKHHYVTPASPTSPELDKLVKNLLESVTKTLKQPVCYTITPFDARSEIVRTQESALGNWAADVLLHAYDESLIEKNTHITFEKEEKEGRTYTEGADAVIICGGTLRGDSQYGPGTITLGDILGKLSHSHRQLTSRDLPLRRPSRVPRDRWQGYLGHVGERTVPLACPGGVSLVVSIKSSPQALPDRVRTGC